MGLTLKEEGRLLAKHSLVYGLGSALNKLAAFLLLPLYTHYLSATEYGIKSLVGYTTDILAVLIAGSISYGFYRFFFEYESEKDRGEVVSTTIIAISIIGFVAISILCLFSKLIAKYLLDDSGLHLYILIALAAMYFQTIVAVAYDYLRAHQKSITFVSFSLSSLLMKIGLNVYLIVFMKLGVLSVFVSNLVASAILFFILVIPILKRHGVKVSFPKLKEIFLFGYPLVVSQFGTFVVHLSDRFFLKALTSISAVGVYSLGYKLGTIPAQFVNTPFNQIYMPRRLEKYQEDDSEEVFGRLFTYFLMFISFAGLLVAVLSRDMLKLIAEPDYWGAYKITPIIVIAIIIFSSTSHFNLGLIIAKKSKYFAYINASSALLVLGLNYFFIKYYGIYGAAVATVIAFIYRASLTYIFSSRYYKIYFEKIRVAKILGCAIFLYTLALFIDLENVYHSMVAEMLLVSCYPFCLYLVKFYSNKEKAQIRAFLNKLLVRLHFPSNAKA